MRHGAARGRIAEYALGLLSPADGYELEKHLESCQACTLEADAFEYATAAVATVATVDPGLLHAANPVPPMPPGTAERIAALVAAALEMDAAAMTPDPFDDGGAQDETSPLDEAAPAAAAATALTQEWIPPQTMAGQDRTNADSLADSGAGERNLTGDDNDDPPEFAGAAGPDGEPAAATAMVPGPGASETPAKRSLLDKMLGRTPVLVVAAAGVSGSGPESAVDHEESTAVAADSAQDAATGPESDVTVSASAAAPQNGASPLPAGSFSPQRTSSEAQRSQADAAVEAAKTEAVATADEAEAAAGAGPDGGITAGAAVLAAGATVGAGVAAVSGRRWWWPFGGGREEAREGDPSPEEPAGAVPSSSAAAAPDVHMDEAEAGSNDDGEDLDGLGMASAAISTSEAEPGGGSRRHWWWPFGAAAASGAAVASPAEATEQGDADEGQAPPEALEQTDAAAPSDEAPDATEAAAAAPDEVDAASEIVAPAADSGSSPATAPVEDLPDGAAESPASTPDPAPGGEESDDGGPSATAAVAGVVVVSGAAAAAAAGGETAGLFNRFRRGKTVTEVDAGNVEPPAPVAVPPADESDPGESAGLTAEPAAATDEGESDEQAVTETAEAPPDDVVEGTVTVIPASQAQVLDEDFDEDGAPADGGFGDFGQIPPSVAAGLASAAIEPPGARVPGPSAGRGQRSGLFGRRGQTPPVAAPDDHDTDEGDEPGADLVPAPRAAPPPARIHRERDPMRHGASLIPKNFDDRLPLSMDSEMARLAVAPVMVMGQKGLSPAYVPGPVEWGLQTYEDDDADEEFGHAFITEGVSSTWRFWAILLAVFSAVLFGIMVGGYFYLRDLQSETQQLSAEGSAGVARLSFSGESPDPRFQLRAEGYYEREARSVLIRLRGLPLVEAGQSFVVWAESPTEGYEIIGLATREGGSSQYVESRNVPTDATRILVTIETKAGETFASEPAGQTILETELP